MINAQGKTMTPVQRAEEALRRAKNVEAVRIAKAEERNKKVREKAAFEARDKYEAGENAKLKRMVGLAVASVIFDAKDEGSITFKFTDGTAFSISAAGDDATYISFGYEVQK